MDGDGELAGVAAIAHTVVGIAEVGVIVPGEDGPVGLVKDGVGGN